MNGLPPSPFFHSGPSQPDEATALTRSHAPGAVADIPEAGPCGFGFELTDPGGTDCSPDQAAAPIRQESAAADLSCIAEIFIGALKLEPVEMWFENSAYPREDELLYEVLLAMDNPHTRGLFRIPDEDGFMLDVEEPPLFLRRA